MRKCGWEETPRICGEIIARYFWIFSLKNRMWARLGGSDSFLDSGSVNAVRSFTSMVTESEEPNGDLYVFGGVDGKVH